MLIETTLLKPTAVKIAGSLSSTFLSKKLSVHQNNKAQQAQIQICIEDLCEQWLLSVMKSLAAMDYEDQALRDFFQHYNHDLECYVKNEQVAEELLKPLSDTGSHYQLNSDRGVAIFAKAFMGLPAQQAAKTTRPLMPAAAPAVLVTRSLPNKG